MVLEGTPRGLSLQNFPHPRAYHYFSRKKSDNPHPSPTPRWYTTNLNGTLDRKGYFLLMLTATVSGSDWVTEMSLVDDAAPVTVKLTQSESRSSERSQQVVQFLPHRVSRVSNTRYQESPEHWAHPGLSGLVPHPRSIYHRQSGK